MQQAGLVDTDGQVEWIGEGSLKSLPTIMDSIWIGVQSRNHLAIISSVPMANCREIIFDFRNQDSLKPLTSNGQKEINAGVWAMYAGNGEQVSDVQTLDINGFDNIFWTANNGIASYVNP